MLFTQVNINRVFQKNVQESKWKILFINTAISISKILLCREKFIFPIILKLFSEYRYIGSQIAFKAQFAI